MLARVYEEFERILTERGVSGSVLEVGAVPSDMSLLCSKPLKNAPEKIGINLDGPYAYKDFKIIKCNANSMECFEDNRFDVVLCNAVLEHDKYFWKTIAEIKRVTKSGGLIVIGTPGYRFFKVEKIRSLLRAVITRIPKIRILDIPIVNLLLWATITYEVHDAPGDYYRFSPQAFKEVFFDGMDEVEVRALLLPPIIIGLGLKP